GESRAIRRQPAPPADGRAKPAAEGRHHSLPSTGDDEWREAAGQLRKLLHRQWRRSCTDIQRPERSRRAERDRRSVPRPHRDWDPRGRSGVGTGDAALSDAAATGGSGAGRADGESMKITLTGEESLRIDAVAGQLTIEAESPDQSYTPFHMLGSACGMCTFAVLQSWASNKSVPVDDLHIDVRWQLVGGEHPLATMNVKLAWPSLSAELWPRALRAANICGVHRTLAEGMAVTVEAPESQSVEIESPAVEESTRGIGRSSAAVAQADGQPRPPGAL